MCPFIVIISDIYSTSLYNIVCLELIFTTGKEFHTPIQGALNAAQTQCKALS